MKKTYFLLSIPLIAVVILLMANSSGSPGGKTGSPGDGGATCVQCHSGTANPVNDWITTDIPMTGYVPGTTYTITVTGTHSGVVKFGFELTAEDESNNKVGTFVITDPTQTQLKNGGNAVTHTSAGNTPSGNSKTWTVDWTAPLMGTGDVTFYTAFNGANGNGNTSGDVIYTSSAEVHLATGINELSFAELEVYPNPTSGMLNLRISDDAEVSINDLSGSEMGQFRALAGNNTIDLGNYPSGIYFLNIIGTDKAKQLKVIVR